jgi:GNAT superfamily N-acetyltransferase
VSKTTTFEFRRATAADLLGISHVRTSVIENHLSRAQLDVRGITNEAVAASFEQDSCGWVAVDDGAVVGFSIADRATRSIFALFVLPNYEQRGIGSRLLKNATGWLFEHGRETIWLTTGANTRAARFYAAQGWAMTGIEPDGQLRFECSYRSTMTPGS